MNISIFFTHNFLKQTSINVLVESTTPPPHREEISFDPPPPPPFKKKKNYGTNQRGRKNQRSKNEELTLTIRNNLVH